MRAPYSQVLCSNASDCDSRVGLASEWLLPSEAPDACLEIPFENGRAIILLAPDLAESRHGPT